MLTLIRNRSMNITNTLKVKDFISNQGSADVVDSMPLGQIQICLCLTYLNRKKFIDYTYIIYFALKNKK